MPADWWLIPLGLGIGFLGTLIGAGGGFILVPVLLVAYPGVSADWVTAVSLAVVACNAISGTIAYARRKRVDYKSGGYFALATVPGAILGALSTSAIPRRYFDIGFGVLMIAACFYLFRDPKERKLEPGHTPHGHTVRELTDATGETYRYTYDLRVGLGISAAVGYISSLLGIGGGIVHVPALVRVLDFPVHVATATSHFVLAITALFGVLTHVANGTMGHVWLSVAMLAPGVVIGAQLGAAVSERVSGVHIVRSLAVALGLAGLRILWAGIR